MDAISGQFLQFLVLTKQGKWVWHCNVSHPSLQDSINIVPQDGVVVAACWKGNWVIVFHKGCKMRWSHHLWWFPGKSFQGNQHLKERTASFAPGFQWSCDYLISLPNVFPVVKMLALMSWQAKLQILNVLTQSYIPALICQSCWNSCFISMP